MAHIEYERGKRRDEWISPLAVQQTLYETHNIQLRLADKLRHVRIRLSKEEAQALITGLEGAIRSTTFTEDYRKEQRSKRNE